MFWAWASVTGLGFGLAMDAMAAAAGLGASRGATRATAWSAAGAFGFAQAAMSGLGAVGGAWLVRVAAAWDHWIAFVLLVGVALHMVWEARHEDDHDAPPATPWRLGVLAFATSVDALAAGLALPMVEVPVLASVTVIGLVTAVLSFGAARAGAWIAERMGPRLHDFGALVLIAIGVRIVVEHLTHG